MSRRAGRAESALGGALAVRGRARTLGRPWRQRAARRSAVRVALRPPRGHTRADTQSGRRKRHASAGVRRAEAGRGGGIRALGARCARGALLSGSVARAGRLGWQGGWWWRRTPSAAAAATRHAPMQRTSRPRSRSRSGHRPRSLWCAGLICGALETRHRPRLRLGAARRPASILKLQGCLAGWSASALGTRRGPSRRGSEPPGSGFEPVPHPSSSGGEGRREELGTTRSHAALLARRCASVRHTMHMGGSSSYNNENRVSTVLSARFLAKCRV